MSMMSDALKNLGKSANHNDPTDGADSESINITPVNTLTNGTSIAIPESSQLFTSMEHPVDGPNPLVTGPTNVLTLTPKPFIGDLIDDAEIPPSKWVLQPPANSGALPSIEVAVSTELETVAQESESPESNQSPASDQSASAAEASSPPTSQDASSVDDHSSERDASLQEPIETIDEDEASTSTSTEVLTTADVISNVVRRVQDVAAEHRNQNDPASTGTLAAQDDLATKSFDTSQNDTSAETTLDADDIAFPSVTPTLPEPVIDAVAAPDTQGDGPLTTLEALFDNSGTDPTPSISPTPSVTSDDCVPIADAAPVVPLAASTDHLSEMLINHESTAAPEAVANEPLKQASSAFESRIESNLGQFGIRNEYEQLATNILPSPLHVAALFGAVDAKPLVAVIGHLAWCIADDLTDPRDVLLIDADVQGRALSKYFNADEAEGFLEACELEGTWQDLVRSTSNSRVKFMPAGGLLGRSELKVETLNEILDATRRTATVVLIFAGAVGDRSLPISQVCKNSFLVVTLGQTAREKAAQAVDTVCGNGGSFQGCIVTDVPK